MEEVAVVGPEEFKEDTAGTRRRRILLFLTASSSLLGLVLLVVGAVTLAEYSVFLDFVTPRYTETAVFLLVMGVIIVGISALGQDRHLAGSHVF